MDIDPYVAIAAAKLNLPYQEAHKLWQDGGLNGEGKSARNEAKLWFWRRWLTGDGIGTLQVKDLKATPILYVDIDSTVRHGYAELGRLVTTREDVVVYPAARAKLLAAKVAGWRVVGITNQGRVALGELTMDQLHDNMSETMAQCEYVFDKLMICQHHPKAATPEMANCWCHKPRIGNVIQAAIDLSDFLPEYYPPHMALFVGNRESDKQCAEAAGIPFMWAYEWRGEAHAPTPEQPFPPPK